MTPERLAVSSIAWRPDEEDQALSALAGAGIRGLEIAPTTVWPDPTGVSRDDASDARLRWADRGLDVVAMQALLFRRPDLQLFGDPAARAALGAHLSKMARLAGWLQVPVMIFGSPRNRGTSGRPAEEIAPIAVDFFRSMARVASDNGTVLCVEPNPAEYGTDFVTTLASAHDLVREVDDPGFGLHIDTGAALIEGKAIESEIRSAALAARHVHLSEPHLAEFGASGREHDWIARAIRAGAYAGWRSIEMVAAPEEPSVPRIERAIDAARRLYS